MYGISYGRDGNNCRDPGGPTGPGRKRRQTRAGEQRTDLWAQWHDGNLRVDGWWTDGAKPPGEPTTAGSGVPTGPKRTTAHFPTQQTSSPTGSIPPTRGTSLPSSQLHPTKNPSVPTSLPTDRTKAPNSGTPTSEHTNTTIPSQHQARPTERAQSFIQSGFQIPHKDTVPEYTAQTPHYQLATVTTTN
jgi:hypothetical protein